MDNFKISNQIAFYFALFLLSANVVVADLPPEISKCSAGDTKCVGEKIMFVIRNYPDGNPAFGLPPVNNITLYDLVISKPHGDSPVQLDFKFKKLDVKGFETGIVDRVVGFGKDLKKSKFEVYGVLPYINITGDYVMNGKVLILPVKGEGDATIVLKNAKFILKTKPDEEIRDGKHFVKISKLFCSLQPEDFKLQIDNLFYGNKQLSDSINEIINENWKDLWAALKDGIDNACVNTIKFLMSSVLNVLPYDDFYKED